MNILKLLTEYFENKSKLFIITVNFTVLIGVGLADYLTGYEIGISLFYLIPISLAAWLQGRTQSIIISFLSVLIIAAADLIAGKTYSHFFVELWNLLMHFGFFTVYAVVLTLVKADLDERKRVEETLKTLSLSVEQSPVSVVITDRAGTIEYVNPKFSEITGYSLDEAIGKNPRILKSGKNRQEVYDQLWETISAGRDWHGELCNKKKNGDLYWESATIAPITDEAGKITHYVAVKQDITDQLIREDLLKKSEKKLRDITSSLGEGVYVVDESGAVSFMNPEAESLLGWTREELSDKNIHDVIHYRKPDGTPLLLDDCHMHTVTKTGERYVSHDEIFIRKDGTSFPVSVISAPVIENNKVIASVIAFRNIAEIREAQDALIKLNQLLELQASTDSLTGILNRLKFNEMLIKELSRSKRYNIPLSLVMFDIDHFKNINDTFGHHMGDIVLRELTAHISKNIRKHDYFARWGGEEFMILLSHITLEPAAQFAENCRIQTEKMKIGGLEGLTCSFGVTELKVDDDIFSFTKRVDAALYRAKSGGRNRVEKL